VWGYVFIHTPECSTRKAKKFLFLAPRCKTALGAWRAVRVPESLIVSSAFSTPSKAKRGDGIVAAAAAKNQGRLGLGFGFTALNLILGSAYLRLVVCMSFSPCLLNGWPQPQVEHM